MGAAYAVGIDLGTTNSTLAYCRLDEERAEVSLLGIPQLVASGTVELRDSLPSFIYIPSREEWESGVLELPWDKFPAVAVGHWARTRSSEVPERCIASAKSWLGHSGVDRHDAILPWGAPDDVKKLSPVEASRHYLEHMVRAWEQTFPDTPLRDQQVALTVPASFDAAARELTLEAAAAAGLPKDLILLEEPQAAVYAWLADHGDDWRKRIQKDDRLLVCDVGGGTTDFSLIHVEEEDGELQLRRVAVGNHILVGGDNMDLLTAHHAQQVFAEKGTKVDAWQSIGLWHACRTAKEKLLEGQESCPVTVLGRGRSVIGGNISVDLQRSQVEHMLVEGFFPNCALDAVPQHAPRMGFAEIGLPYEQDTAVTRHLAAFLNGGEGLPNRILFNGGSLKAPVFRERIVGLLGEWGRSDIAVLDNSNDLDTAVSRGAAYYAAIKSRGGIRIRGGSPRAYYIGVETAGLAIPGAPRPLNAYCVLPMGMEEGSSLQIPGESYGLVVGEHAHFRVFSSANRRQDTAGVLLRSWSEDELQETDSLNALLPVAAGMDAGSYVAVRLETRLTELGLFELWCIPEAGGEGWKLEFSVRGDDT